MRQFAGALTAVLAIALIAPASPIRVSLDYFENSNHVPLYVALDRGFFEAEGLDVDIYVPGNPSDPVKLAAARAIDIALTPQINYLIARSEGLPLLAMGALIDHPLGGLLALRGSGVHALEDLVGQRVGYALEPLEPILWKTVFECAGIDPSGLELINVGFNTITALVTGNVEAVGAFRNYEVLQLEELGYDPVFFPQEAYCVPMTYEIVLVAHPAFVTERQTDAASFLRALARAIEWTRDHPAEALMVFFNRFPELDDDLNRRSFECTLPLYAVGASLNDVEVWRAMQTYLVDRGLMLREFPVQELYIDWPLLGE